MKIILLSLFSLTSFCTNKQSLSLILNLAHDDKWQTSVNIKDFQILRQKLEQTCTYLQWWLFVIYTGRPCFILPIYPLTCLFKVFKSTTPFSKYLTNHSWSSFFFRAHPRLNYCHRFIVHLRSIAKERVVQRNLQSTYLRKMGWGSTKKFSATFFRRVAERMPWMGGLKDIMDK